MIFKKRAPKPRLDMAGRIPTIRSSICTGEQVAGFKDPSTGRFTEVMLIRGQRDIDEFTKAYGISESDIKREW